MKKSTKKFTGSIATLATVASIIAPSAAVFAAETSVDEYVSYAEKTANFYDFNVAFGKVLALPKAEQASYLARLAAVEGKAKTADIQAVLKAMDDFGPNRDLTNFYKVYDLVNKVTEEKNRLYLQNELNTWGHSSVFTADVVVATDAIIKAWGTKTVADVTAAKEAVANLKLAGNASWCNEQIAQIQAKMPVYITGVTVVNSTTARVALSAPVADADFTNFSVNNGLTVISATLSADKKSVDVKVNQPFTRQQLYTLTASGLTNLSGDVSEDLTGTFKWSVNEGVTVALTSTSLKIGGTASVSIVDQDGKKVTPASVEVVSSNENVVSVDGSKVTAEAAGTADVTVKVTLVDDTVLTNTFTVTVAKASDTLANQGITLVDGLDAAPENTVVFNGSAKTTSLFVGETKVVAMYNTVNGDPDIKPVDFTDAKVVSQNATIATAVITDGVLSVTADAKQTGTASFKVTLADGTTRTFSIVVKATAALTGIDVDTTSVKLSDETVQAAEVEGINVKTVNVDAVDQYGNVIDFGETGKVTVTTNTEGLVLGNLTENALGFTDGKASFTVTTTKDTVVDGKVYVKYFKKATDATPAVTKVVNVDVVDVSAKATPAALDVVAPALIDANVNNSDNAHAIDFATTAFVLDSKGNRIDKLEDEEVTLVGSNKYAEVSGTTLQFADAKEAMTLLATEGTLNVDVKSDGITKRLPIKYVNTASIPVSATVNTKPVAIKLASGVDSITFEDLMFGVLDAGQLVNDDDALNEYIAVSSSASNGGYQYNKPVFTFKNASGAVIATGANLYGVANDATNGNIWTKDTENFVGDKFDVEFAIANVTTTKEGNVDATAATLTDTITAANAGDAVSFTLVIKAVRVSGVDADKSNLLAAPVTVNVTVAK